MDENLQHLKLLSTFHYVVGGIAALFACLPAAHLIIGIALIIASKHAEGGNETPPEFIGWFFAVIGGSLIILGWAFAACAVTAGRFLARRVHYPFCLVMGCIECAFMPFGTVLGIFTILVLMKPEVKGLFRTADGGEAQRCGSRAP